MKQFAKMKSASLIMEWIQNGTSSLASKDKLST